MSFADKVALGVGILWVATGIYLGKVEMVGIGWLATLIVLKK